MPRIIKGSLYEIIHILRAEEARRARSRARRWPPVRGRGGWRGGRYRRYGRNLVVRMSKNNYIVFLLEKLINVYKQF